ncbi:O-antigen ligase family protein [Arvimicrobium flavum]|uniref:O-antigen ligase family protein n=1 Tax=Arvimicrobium flavum TaxID=3393320 RepID=UPI00237AA85D|nr:O-antigen ligase family protein [Mesorhizobium shangrilense]
MRDAASASLQRLEFGLVCAAVFFAPYSAFRHPDLFFTAGDFFFLMAIMLRLLSGWPIRPLGEGTLLWYAGFVMLNYGLLVSSLINGDMARAWVVFAQYLFAYILLPFAVSRSSYDDAITLAKCCVYGMVTMCVFGIGAYALGFNAGHARHFAIVTGGGRLTGFVDNANGLAGYIALTLPLLCFLTTIRAFKLPTTIALAVPLLVALVLASSNTGLIGALLSTGIYMIGARRPKILAVFVMVCGGAVATVVLWGEHFLPAVFQRRVLNAVTEGDITEAGTFVDRYELIKEAWRLADTHLLLGMGTDQYRTVSEQGLSVHNAYLLLLNEGGLVALCGYLLILGSALIAPWQGRHRRDGGAILLCTVAVATAVAFIAFSGTHMYARFLTVPLLLTVGAAVASGRGRTRRPAAPSTWEPMGQQLISARNQ